jgi:hypothetical protein
VRLPGSTVGNDVATVDDGFVVSTTRDFEGLTEVSVEEAMAGADTGGVPEWSPVRGWHAPARHGDQHRQRRRRGVTRR